MAGAMKSHTEYLTFNVPARMGFENITSKVEAAVRKYAGDPVVGKVISFIQDGSPRALLQPARSFIVETESSQA